MKHLWVCACLALAACGGPDTVADAGNDPQEPDPAPMSNCADDTAEIQVSGEVVRVFPQFSYNEPVTFSEGSLATVTLSEAIALGGDGPITEVLRLELSPVPELPFDYCLGGAIPTPPDGAEYVLQARLEQVAGESTVGDLINEVQTLADPPGDEVDIEVSGLEDCDDMNSGGFCTTG